MSFLNLGEPLATYFLKSLKSKYILFRFIAEANKTFTMGFW